MEIVVASTTNRAGADVISVPTLPTCQYHYYDVTNETVSNYNGYTCIQPYIISSFYALETNYLLRLKRGIMRSSRADNPRRVQPVRYPHSIYIKISTVAFPKHKRNTMFAIRKNSIF